MAISSHTPYTTGLAVNCILLALCAASRWLPSLLHKIIQLWISCLPPRLPPKYLQSYINPWALPHIVILTAESLSLFQSVQFSSVAQSCPTLFDPMNCSMPSLPVHHQLLEFTQTHVHWVGDAVQPSHPLSSPFPPAPNPSQHQSLFHWVNSSHEVAKVLDLQL